MSNLQITFIPPEYWTKSENFFQLLSSRGKEENMKEPKIPENIGFFLMWLNKNYSDLSELENTVKNVFPQIPAQRLMSCKIALAFPNKKDIDPQKKTKGKNIQQTNPSPHNTTKFFKIRHIKGKVVPIPPMVNILFGFKIGEERKDRKNIKRTYSNSIKTWSYLTKFTIELLSRGCFVPTLERKYSQEQNQQNVENPYENTKNLYSKMYKTAVANWKTILRSLNDWNRFNKIIQKSPLASYNLPISIREFQENTTTSDRHAEKPIKLTEGVWNPSYVFISYMDMLSDYIIRKSMGKSFRKKLYKVYGMNPPKKQKNIYQQQKSDTTWGFRFLDALSNKEKIFEIQKFSETPIPNIIEKWNRKIQGFPFQLGVMFTFRLQYPDNPEDDWDLGYYIQPLQEFNHFIHLGDFWNCNIEQRRELENICEDIELLEKEVLRALGTAAKYFPPIYRSLEGPHPKQIKLDTSEVMEFLKYSMYLLIQAGYNVELPEQFREQGEQRLTAELVIEDSGSSAKKKREKEYYEEKKGELTSKRPAMFGMEAMLDYEWKLSIENEELTDQEFLQLAETQEPLVFIKGKWVLLNPQDVDALKPVFEEGKEDQEFTQPKGKINYTKALQLGMTGKVIMGNNATYNIKLKGNFQNTVETLKGVKAFREIKTPGSFQGKLREYQKVGLKWLSNMARLKFGVCLADDMGLGKTIEIIAFLLHREELTNRGRLNDKGVLIICPTSVLFNWKREIQKFGPKLNVIIHHGRDRYRDKKALVEYTKEHVIILSTYGTVRNDIEFLESIPFTGVILDESQNIKNYQAQKTKAILKLRSQYRIALSGTPIENRLNELWTLFQFLNPNLLGKRKSFKHRFVSPIENFQDEDAAEKLHKIVSPFILRRVKTDESIIKDLPEKNEIKVSIELSTLQKRLYQHTVETTMNILETSQDSRKRKGLILKLLTQIKQICNHPLQFLHLTDQKKVEHYYTIKRDLDQTKDIQLSHIPLKEIIKSSMKLRRFIEMTDEVLESGDKMLVFTQYTQMGDILKYVLKDLYDFEVLFFHGSLAKNKREEMVDRFQSSDLTSPPIMILSLRAGGTGLNLTQASTVFHYDRWWNPAVEDQATDRAYRIGQTKTVYVYKFVAAGTIEEKIDKILEEKRALADQIIKSKDETFITNLSNKELEDIFMLTN